MTPPETINLGGREFECRPLRLGQLRGLLDALDEMQGKTGGASIDAAAKLLVVGLPAANLTVDEVLDLDASVSDLNDAVAVVIRVAGRLKVAPPGEGAPQPEV